jgi:hypothetical protein
MKKVSIIVVACMAGLLAITGAAPATPSHVFAGNPLPDLTMDKDFTKTVAAVIALQEKIDRTNTGGLMVKAAAERLTVDEMQLLASNLGYANYARFTDGLGEMGLSAYAVAAKYPKLDNGSYALAVDRAFDKLKTQASLAGTSFNAACFRTLLGNIFICIRTSPNKAALIACLQAAYAAYQACSN